MEIPKIIYLQWYTEDGVINDEVTWCQDKINEDDISYTLTRAAEPPLEQTVSTCPHGYRIAQFPDGKVVREKCPRCEGGQARN